MKKKIVLPFLILGSSLLFVTACAKDENTTTYEISDNNNLSTLSGEKVDDKITKKINSDKTDSDITDYSEKEIANNDLLTDEEKGSIVYSEKQMNPDEIKNVKSYIRDKATILSNYLYKVKIFTNRQAAYTRLEVEFNEDVAKKYQDLLYDYDPAKEGYEATKIELLGKSEQLYKRNDIYYYQVSTKATLKDLEKDTEAPTYYTYQMSFKKSANGYRVLSLDMEQGSFLEGSKQVTKFGKETIAKTKLKSAILYALGYNYSDEDSAKTELNTIFSKSSQTDLSKTFPYMYNQLNNSKKVYFGFNNVQTTDVIDEFKGVNQTGTVVVSYWKGNSKESKTIDYELYMNMPNVENNDYQYVIQKFKIK